MIKINEDERRNFFRIDDEVYLTINTVTEGEYKAAPETLENIHNDSFSLSANFASLNNKTNPVLNNIKQLHPDIGEYLEVLNSKIDSLGQHILLENSNYNESNLIVANISASGIQFETEDNYKARQAVKLELVLLPEKIGVLIFGRAIDTKDKRVSIEFEFLRTEDQELMIKHNLNKQMSELREKNDNY